MSVLVHKAVEPDKLSVKGKQRHKALIADLIAGRHSDAWVQPKYDGVYAQFVYDERDGWIALSRTGQHLLSVGERILDTFYTKALPERRYMGELWLPGTQHQTINGRARKQSPQHLELMLFDSVGPDQQQSYEERYEALFDGPVISIVPNLKPEIYVEDDLYDLAAEYKHRTSAYDGLILRDPWTGFTPGAGKDGEVIKIKPRAEGDFRVIGVTKGVGNRSGGIGALVVDLGHGKHSEVGSGLTNRDVFEAEGLTSEATSIIGRIATVEYLGLTKDGKLREPSFKGYRFDKDTADILGEEIQED